MTDRLEQLAQAFAGQPVLVTGGTGGLGRHLVAVLGKTCRVHVLARSRSRAESLWGTIPVTVHQGVLQDVPLLEKLCTEVTTIFHLASYSPAVSDPAPEENPLHWTVTVEGTRNLLSAAKPGKVERLIFCSSTRVIDGSNTRYAQAKREAEKMVLAAQGPAFHVAVLRLAPLYGFSERGNVASLVRSIRGGRFPPLPDLGDQRSLLHVADAIQALLLVAASEAANGRVYTVTDLQSYSTRGIYELVCRKSGKPVPGWTFPMGLLNAAARIGDLIQRITGWPVPINSDRLRKLQGTALFDGDEIQRELGYEPIYTLEKMLEKGIEEGR